MCDVKKYNTLMNDFLSMDLRDLRELIINANSDELRDFYVNTYNFVLQRRQKEILKEHVY